MTDPITRLIARQGTYTGTGLDHEGQEFHATLRLSAPCERKGVALDFRAVTSDGLVTHEERSLLSRTIRDDIALWVMSTNHPGVVEHQLAAEETGDECSTLRFSFGAQDDRQAFREIVSLDLWRNGDVGYRYAWAMPGQDMAERSGARMRAATAPALDIWHVGLPVTDLDRSVAFYTDALGLSLVGRDEQTDKRQAFVATKQGGFTLELLAGTETTAKRHQPDHLAFECEDLEKVRERLRATGVDVGDIAAFDNGVRILSVRDPDGVRLDLFSGRALYEAELKP